MSSKGKVSILLEGVFPRNKIARFLVLEVIALLISLFLFVSLTLVFLYFILFKIRQYPPISIEEDSLGRAFVVVGAIIVAMRYSLVCSIPLGVWFHVYVFKKFSLRREEKDG
jgi:hypothetical protein